MANEDVNIGDEPRFIDEWFERAAAEESLDSQILSMIRDATQDGSLNTSSLVQSLSDVGEDVDEG